MGKCNENLPGVFSMTEGAQQALRRTMEIYSNTTRFALACNYSEKVIEPIQSRCAILRFSRLTDPQVLARVLQICQKENVSKTQSREKLFNSNVILQRFNILRMV